jgi:hypothetical protein
MRACVRVRVPVHARAPSGSREGSTYRRALKRRGALGRESEPQERLRFGAPRRVRLRVRTRRARPRTREWRSGACCGMRRARVCSTLDAARCMRCACLSIYPHLQASVDELLRRLGGPSRRRRPDGTLANLRARASPCARACVSVSVRTCLRACLCAQVRRRGRICAGASMGRRGADACVLAARTRYMNVTSFEKSPAYGTYANKHTAKCHNAHTPCRARAHARTCTHAHARMPARRASQ